MLETASINWGSLLLTQNWTFGYVGNWQPKTKVESLWSLHRVGVGERKKVKKPYMVRNWADNLVGEGDGASRDENHYYKK